MSATPWTYEIDGDDLIVRNVTVTCFGGSHDDGDNGQTESGADNSKDDGPLYCALPIRSTESATAGSPLAFKGPHIPWFTKVQFWRQEDEIDGHPVASAAIECELVDNGPDVEHYPTHAGDLSPSAAHFFAPSVQVEKLANTWSGEHFCYRIIGGAKWIS